VSSPDELHGDIQVLRALIESLRKRSRGADDVTLKAATMVLERRHADLARLSLND
jgi:hypothetical protein